MFLIGVKNKACMVPVKYKYAATLVLNYDATNATKRRPISKHTDGPGMNKRKLVMGTDRARNKGRLCCEEQEHFTAILCSAMCEERAN
jgi:hypothetical protein